MAQRIRPTEQSALIQSVNGRLRNPEQAGRFLDRESKAREFTFPQSGRR